MTGEKRRLFFALWPADDTGEAIVRNTRDVVADCGGRPVLPQNLHITLAFLHSVDVELLPCIRLAARRAATGPFNLLLSDTGYWHRSRILWLAPQAGTEAVAQLADALWRELEGCGFSPERRRYQPHVTLARKANAPEPAAAVTPVQWHAESFCLVQSITGGQQSEYRVLETYPLSTRQAKLR